MRQPLKFEQIIKSLCTMWACLVIRIKRLKNHQRSPKTCKALSTIAQKSSDLVPLLPNLLASQLSLTQIDSLATN